MQDIEQTIREVNGTMAIEGMPLTEEDKERLRLIMRGELTYKDAIRGILEKYAKYSVKNYDQV